jgi:hypothetical protein
LSADPIVATALSQFRPVSPTTASANQVSENPLIVRMIASAVGPSRVERTAIVRVGAELPGGYAVLAWGGSYD